jgi:hypothetical protein
MCGQRQEPRLFLGEDVGDRAVALVRMRTLMRDIVPPAPKLGVQIVDIDKRARRKEGVTQILNLSLDFPLLVPPRRRTRPWREVIMRSKRG